MKEAGVYTSDEWEHLARTRVFKKKGLPKTHPMRSLGGEYCYPSLLYHLLALLPEGFLKRFYWAFSPLIHALHALLAFVVAWQLTGNAANGLIAGVVFLLTPESVSQSWFLSPRPLAAFLFSASVLSAYVFVNGGGLIWLALAVAGAALALLTHKFAGQALAFTMLFLSLATGRIEFVAVFVAGVVLAVALSRGFYLKVLKGQFFLLNFWRKELGPKLFKEFGPLGTWREWLKVLLLPSVFVLFVAATNAFYWWTLALLVAFCVTQLRPLRFLGEPHRYLSYAVLPSAVLVATAGLPAEALVALFVVCLAMSWTAYRKFFAEPMKAALPALKFVRTRKERVVLYWPRVLCGLLMYFSEKSVYCGNPYKLHLMEGFYPDKTKTLKQIAKENRIRLLVVYDSAVDALPGGKRKEVGRAKRIFGKYGYSVYLYPKNNKGERKK